MRELREGRYYERRQCWGVGVWRERGMEGLSSLWEKHTRLEGR
jgi:hypothetical protein